MKWSFAGAALGVLTILFVFARLESDLPTSLQAQKLVLAELNEVELIRYEETGRKLETSRAAHAVQIEGESEMLLGALYVEREDEQGVLWQLDAPRGISNPADDTLVLTGGVSIRRGPDVILETEELAIDADTSSAMSSSQAKLRSRDGVTVGSQLQIDFQGGTSELRGNIKTSLKKGSVRR